jgi:hypothetical protein
LSLVSERDEWTETSCAALFKAHSLARLLLGGELHRTMQLTKSLYRREDWGRVHARGKKCFVAAADRGGGAKHAEYAWHHHAFRDFQALAIP